MVRLSPGLALLRLLKPGPGPINGGDSYSGPMELARTFCGARLLRLIHGVWRRLVGSKPSGARDLPTTHKKNSDQKPEFQGEL